MMLKFLLGRPRLLQMIVRVMHGLKIRRLKLGNSVFVFSWKDVREVLARDNDFRIEPINGDRMRRVAGPFFLGLDRCPLSFSQRDRGGRAIASPLPDLAEAIEADAETAMATKAKALDAVQGYARLVALSTTKRVFGIPGASDTDLMEVTRSVFHQCFLNLQDADKDVMKKGEADGVRLRRWIFDEIARRREGSGKTGDFLAYLLDLQAAIAAGEVDQPPLPDEEVATIAAGYIVGAVDTTTTAFAHIVWEIMQDPVMKRGVLRDLDDRERLLGWCLEALRRRPQAAILFRLAAADATLSGMAIPKGTLMVPVLQAAHLDPEAFPDPSRMDPDRPREHYMHFGNGPHVCAGRDINAIQLPILLKHLFKRGVKDVGPIRKDGPFPDQLLVTLE